MIELISRRSHCPPMRTSCGGSSGGWGHRRSKLGVLISGAFLMLLAVAAVVAPLHYVARSTRQRRRFTLDTTRVARRWLVEQSARHGLGRA